MRLWTIDATQPTRELASQLTVSNGLIGIKDLTEIPQLQTGTATDTVVYVNGFYDYEQIQYGEAQFGFPQVNQTMVPLPAPTCFELWLDDQPVDLKHGQLLDQHYQLSMKNGTFEHRLLWEERGTGRQLQLTLRRVTSLQTAALLSQQLQVRAVNFERGQLRVLSGLHPQATVRPAGFDPRLTEYNTAEVVAKQRLKALTPTLQGATFTAPYSKQQLNTITYYDQPGRWLDSGQWQVTLPVGRQAVALTKNVWYELGAGQLTPKIKAALTQSFQQIATAQAATLDDFWATSDIKIKGDDDSQRAIRFSQFGLLQALGRHSGQQGMAAKGLTGSGYSGHYFWDTEIYEAPFFYWNHPELARRLLMVRYRQLPHAKDYAKSLGLPGALFPWRTINGTESSAYFPASTAAIHIDADVAYLVIRYYQITHDEVFMHDYGRELLVETSRFYLGYGNFDQRKGFVLNTVTGPDEYTALVDNNAYTNYMVRFELRYLTQHFDWHDLRAQGVTVDEWHQFKAAAAQMYFERHGDLIAQDDSFLSKRRLDLSTIPRRNFPLLMHYHPLILYRLQVLKQADLLLAMVLLPEEFTTVQVKTNYDYYEPLTTHDSSLSPAIYAIAAARFGERKGAIKFFKRTINTDLQNLQGNTADGLHLAAMGGSWITFAWGLMGLTVDDHGVQLHPVLPQGWTSCQFKLRYRAVVYTIKVTPDQLTITGGQPAKITVNQATRHISIQP
ncbi:glycoside hydrolase family 65 protein [Lactiplantibacillus modestisalitolerans]|uniref:Glycoside hydrolase family 65 protein n=1 Tax=Lactiplantibacillus modestisalitolerans TaxID=1457219 RepID=A0ABV5WVD0_9LACO|nr:glycoside hydrolase family 65 protein [Lactiplantibacillus modestisalitolerans]